ncbi:MAG TPA: ComEC/Rec2 family competence protein, partial [Syntrophorhabdaceae bacterium]|nr:ComEC/Rec2 family competence protein [Syntrophorhabdaceae bacterium]
MPPTQSENRYGSLFFFGVLAFALGIYVQANYRLPTVYTSVLCIALLITAPFLFVHARRTACICLLFCFVLAGIVRLGTIPDDSAILYNSYQSTQPNAPLVYEGVIIESSPNSKIVKLISPEQFRGIRATLSSSENMTINDRIKIYGQLKELTLTYKNPSLISSRWLRRIEGVSYRLNGDIVSIVRDSSIVESWRRYLSDKIQNAGAKHADILKALTIGDTAGISIDTKQVFSETGTSHILAISGSNIAIVTSFFFLLLRLLMRVSDVLKLRGDDKRYAALLSIPFVLFFVLTAGAGIPIIRAAIMITIYMCAIFFGRNRHLSNSLAVSALIILLIYPHSLFTPAFQLSFVCVFSIYLYTIIYCNIFGIRQCSPYATKLFGRNQLHYFR